MQVATRQRCRGNVTRQGVCARILGLQTTCTTDYDCCGEADCVLARLHLLYLCCEATWQSGTLKEDLRDCESFIDLRS